MGDISSNASIAPAESAVAGDPVADTARERFGVSYLYPYQRLVIANLLEANAAASSLNAPGSGGRGGSGYAADDVDHRSRQIVILPTGAGKSLCFQLPALMLEGLTVVVYPLLSLIGDQKRRLAELSIPCEPLTGRSTAADLARIEAGVKEGRVRLLLTNPESLATQRAQRLLEDVAVSHLVIDEAHCVAQWGETFRPSYLELGAAVRAISPAVVTGFTATASPHVLSRIDTHLFGGTGYHLVRGNPDRPNIRYAVLPVVSKSRALRELLGVEGIAGRPETSGVSSTQDRPQTSVAGVGARVGTSITRGSAASPGGTGSEPRGEVADSETAPPAGFRPAVVFCRTRGRCERTARELRRGLGDDRIRFYHAGLSKTEKQALEQWFFASEDGVLIATCAYGMGVDKPDIRTVIHRDLPPSVESYLQESGRAGRDGLPSQAVVLASPREMAGPGAGPYIRPGAGPDGDQDLSRSHRAGPGPRPSAGPEDAAKPGFATLPSPLAEYLCGTRCRREVLIEALGAEAEACSGCDVCDVCDGTAGRESLVAEAVTAWLGRRRRRYTPRQAAAVLVGTARQAPVPWSPAREPVFALLAEWSLDEIEEALEELRTAGRLRIIRRGPWRGRLSL